MKFSDWKDAILKSVEKHGFNPTYRRFGLSSASLRLIVNKAKEGDDLAGFRSWRRQGEQMEAKEVQKWLE